MGINLNPDELNRAYDKFLLLADRKKDINDSDLMIIVGVNRNEAIRRIRLKYLQVVCGKNSVPMATVKLNIDGEIC
jgi:2-isopropylmalate synthase